MPDLTIATDKLGAPLTEQTIKMRALISAIDTNTLTKADLHEIKTMLRQHDGVLKYINNATAQGATARPDEIKRILEGTTHQA